MPWIIEFHPTARKESRRAIAWYADKNPAAGAALAAEIEVGVERLAVDPESWPRLDRRHHFYLLKRFPILIIFRTRSARIQVVAVAHGARRPGYWRRRRFPKEE